MQLTRLAALTAAFGAAAAFQITSPSANTWWVAKSVNTMAWTCEDKSFPQFTVLIGNSDQKVLVQPIAFIAQQNNFDCSKSITPDQSDRQPATGYTIIFADPLNNTNVFATSEPFEIKPFGSAYATTSSAGPSGTASGSGGSRTSTGSGPAPTGNSGVRESFSTVVALAAAALGFAFA